MLDFSIVIPARNEEKYLPECVEAISRAKKDYQLEIIVVVNRSTDKTEELARELSCRVTHSEAKNLSSIRNKGAELASGKYLITIDADSRMSEGMLVEIDKELSSEKYVGGGVLMFPERWSLGIILTGVMLLPVALRDLISGGLFFTKLDYFRAVGGFNEELVSAEDIDFARRLKAYGKTKGLKFKNLWRAHIVTSCRKFDRFGDWYFVLRPWLIWKGLRGRDRALADKVWYDFSD